MYKKPLPINDTSKPDRLDMAALYLCCGATVLFPDTNNKAIALLAIAAEITKLAENMS